MARELPREIIQQTEDLKSNFLEITSIRIISSPTVQGNYTTFVAFSDEFEEEYSKNDTLHTYMKSVMKYSVLGDDYTYAVQFENEEFINDMLTYGGKEVFLWER